jgi:hypothetical protein
VNAGWARSATLVCRLLVCRSLDVSADGEAFRIADEGPGPDAP